MLYKTTGIIIKRRDFGEADRLLTIYTRDRGKITAIAKGVRRIKSKLAGHLELFYLTDLVIAEGKNIDTITGAVNLKNYYQLRDDLHCSSQAYFLSELIDKMVPEHEVHKEVFDLLEQSLAKIDHNQLLLPYFSIRLLGFLGHGPELQVCAQCHNKLSAGDKHYFSNQLGGIICQNCLAGNKNASRISIEDIKLLRILAENNIGIIDRVSIKTNSVISEVVGSFLEFTLEGELKSKKFLQ